MKKILFGLLALGSITAFANEKTIEYSITGFGEAPDFVRVDYKEESIDHDQCRFVDGGKYICKGSLTLTLARFVNDIEVGSRGTKTLDIEAKAFTRCNNKYVEITPPNGLYAKSLPGRNGLYLNGKIDFSVCY